MSETHPYWAYAAVPGGLNEEEEKAVIAEGRRAFALEVAIALSGSAEVVLYRATRFEAYLKGEEPA